MGLFDIYRIVDEQTTENQRVENVYFYQMTSATGTHDAQEVADAYMGQVLPAVRAVQESDSVLHTGVIVRNLFDPSDLSVNVISLAGTGAFGTQPLPTFNAVGVRLQQDNGAVRNGSKRYAGVDEGVQDRGVITSSGYGTALDTLCTALAATLVDGIIPALVPIVVKRLLVGGEYVLPDALVDAVFGAIVQADWAALLTSQTSRKIGNGV